MFDEIAPTAPISGASRPRIAVIGSGVSGLCAAWALKESCDVTVFEREARIGGHANTVLVEEGGGPVPVDTGFIVFNDRNYPNLAALFACLDVETHKTEMHFSVSVRDRDIEYSSQGVSGLFADLRNLTRPRFFSMIADILRFYAGAAGMAEVDDDLSLGDFLQRKRYGRAFIRDHLLPMAAAIWSCPVSAMLDFPAKSLARFFINHGLAELGEPVIWRSVVGGSASYVSKLTATFRDRIRLFAEVASVRRRCYGVELTLADGRTEIFDEVVFACHAPQARALLIDADARENRILSAFSTQRNIAVLHGDDTQMPRRRRAWASWNYLSANQGENDISVTYWMNELQRLPTQKNYFVTLNPITPPRPDSIIASFTYDHPVFDAPAMRAQREIWSIQGVNRVWFCGAWLGYGFHEDGVQSGLAVAEALSNWRRPWRFDMRRERLQRVAPAADWRKAAA